MRVPDLKTVGWMVALAAMALIPITTSAQAAPAGKGGEVPYASKWDIFAGYSYLSPHGTVNVPQPTNPPVTEPFSYDPANVGGIFSVARYFNRYIGIQGEFSEHEWGVQRPATNIGTRGNDDGFLTLGGGLIARAPNRNITPFVHALFDGQEVNGPDYNPDTWGPGLTLGGGLDYETPWLNHHLAIRLFQADYEYMHVNFGTGAYGGVASINAARLSAGIVFHAGAVAPPPPVTLACTATPGSVFAGQQVMVTAAAGNLNPRDSVVYSWSGDGVSGSGSTATVVTTDLAPGLHAAQVTVKEGKRGKEGAKPWQTASCSASFTVKAFEPPTISCTANPSTIPPSATSTITCQAVSPQNRPLTYSYSATAGTITGTGPTAEYSSVGAPLGAVGITGTVADDKGHTASAPVTVIIQAPPKPPAPHVQALCSLSFSRDKRRPARVDNEAKACLDQVALDLKQQADARAVIVGDSTRHEKAIEAREERLHEHNQHVRVENFAAQRAVNAKAYLVREQGIDSSRISVATGGANEQAAQDYLVPAGADFSADIEGTKPVNESAVRPQYRRPLPRKHRARHRKAAPAK